MSNPAGVLFDAYGTLFDIAGLSAACLAAAPDHPDLLDRWRAKQLEFSWLRSLMNRYVDFQQITREALTHTLRRLDLTLPAAEQDALNDAWLTLDLFPEVSGMLDRLGGVRAAILSNGSSAMLDAACRRVGLTDRLDAIISVDEAKVFKPAPAAYELGVRRLGMRAGEILFVSSNTWDAAGAKAFGYRVAWVNRGRVVFDQPGFPPDAILDDLRGLPALLGDPD